MTASQPYEKETSRMHLEPERFLTNALPSAGCQQAKSPAGMQQIRAISGAAALASCLLAVSIAACTPSP
ncbi:hypothetical protein [Candidatus Methylobacter favarea]|uniref:hypothetical protein n=1 Tax=Candidatus Methylobacter favarea TaxID=2707345 RepID=UPI00157D2AC0|nr:hypothetical protein [Candidatus Methylobacter favarea]